MAAVRVECTCLDALLTQVCGEGSRGYLSTVRSVKAMSLCTVPTYCKPSVCHLTTTLIRLSADVSQHGDAIPIRTLSTTIDIGTGLWYPRS